MFYKTETLIISFTMGIIPSLIWLWFWLKEENEKEPKKVLIATFLIGMVAVVFIIPVQKLIQNYFTDINKQLTLWALVEELIKYIAVMIVIWNTQYLKKPIDYPIYMITGALGFAALENTLFLIDPIAGGENFVAILTGSIRFLGSTLLHSISSAIIGIALGLSFYMNRFIKKIYLLIGIITATLLHTLFNFFIINNVTNDFFEFIKTFIMLWVVTIIIMLLFEKLRRLSGEFN